jgi:hypothetical protein
MVYGGGAECLGTGTGFLVRSVLGTCLVTARHVLTGRHHYSGDKLHSSGTTPTEVRIYHRVKDSDNISGAAYIGGAALYDESNFPRWYEDTDYSHLCDYAVLPIQIEDFVSEQFVMPSFLVPEFSNEAVKANMGENVQSLSLTPGEAVSVVGYPFGQSVGPVFPIWATGALAMDLAFVHIFGQIYIDCRARPGQSGAPVFVKRSGTATLEDGTDIMFDGWARAFVGVYSGRVHKDSDIGIVYSAKRLKRTIDQLQDQATAKMPTDRKIGGEWTL